MAEVGRVKWFDERRGYGFIAGKNGLEYFVHFSNIRIQNFKTLEEGEEVRFNIKDSDRAHQAVNVFKLDSPEIAEEDVASQEFQGREFIALTLVEGHIKLVSLSADGKYRFVDGLKNLHKTLYVWSCETQALQTVLEELEEMVNDAKATEQDFHEFFERNPEFILGDEYKTAHSKIALTTESGEKMIPDFVLEPLDIKSLCDLLELKKPSTNVFILKKSRMRFSAAVMEACAQLREYSSYFDEKRRREAIQEKYGLLLYRPKMFVILGRRGTLSPIEVRRAEEDLPKLVLKTYDDLIGRVKAKINATKKGRWRTER